MPTRFPRFASLVFAGLLAVAPTVVDARPATAAGAPVSGGATAAAAPESAVVGSVSAGGLHTCGVRADGTVACWGANASGESTPPAGWFLSVSAGTDHTCGVGGDGALSCWGANDVGQSTPPPGTFTAVSAAGRYTCAIATDSTLACWGDGPNQTEAPAGTFRLVSTAGGHACAIRTDGTAACWGANWYGQTNAPTGTFRDLGAGAFHTCGLRTDGTVACWGVTPDPTAVMRYVPFNFGQADAPEGTFDAISADDRHTCGLRSDGTVACWGAQDHHEPEYLVDTGQADPPAGTFTAVSAATGHTCGVRTDGTMACWGSDSLGQATPPAGRFVGASVTAGYAYTCATRTYATVACWGWDFAGEATPPGGAFKAVAVGRMHTCGIRPDGQVVCWGHDDARIHPPSGTFQVVSAGDAFTCGLRTEGTVECWGQLQVSPSGTTFVGLSAGFNHACGIRTDGAVACWGSAGAVPSGVFVAVSAGYEQTCAIRADGTVVCWSYGFHSGPSTPLSGTFRSLTADGGDQPSSPFERGGHVCGIRTDGSVACWGYNRRGQASPPAGTFNALSAGVSHTCGIRSDNFLVCWGDNGWGQTTVPAIFDDEAPTAPGGPVLPPGASRYTTGVFPLTWDASHDPDPADTLTYTLRHRDAGSAFVAVRSGLTSASHSFTTAAPEVEGTWVYRVTAADDRGLAGDASVDSEAVVVDRTAPVAPTLAVHSGPGQSPLYLDPQTNTSWFKDQVLLDVVANGDPVLRDGSPGSGVDPGSSASFPITANGRTTVTRSVTDRSGNRSAPSAALAVHVDGMPPTLSLSGCPTTAVLQGSTVVVSASASDGQSGIAVRPPASHVLDTSVVGLRQLTLSATDNVGHITTRTCSYDVVYRFTGFASPIVNFSDQTATSNKVRAGSVVRLKFSLDGNQGGDIIAGGSPSSVPIVGCGALTVPLDWGDPTGGPDGSGLAFDPKTGHYTYSWQTQSAWADTCRQFVLTLDDGSSHRANFRFSR